MATGESQKALAKPNNLPAGAVQLLQLLGEQVEEHPSTAKSLLPAPLSHLSPKRSSTIPSPQIGSLHPVLQPLGVTPLFSPSSHCSPSSTIPSPQKGSLQLISIFPTLVPWALQELGALSEFSAPLSHSSLAPSLLPLPHSHLPVAEHPSLLLVFPSSHCSSASTTPSPRAGILQVSLQGERGVSPF